MNLAWQYQSMAAACFTTRALDLLESDGSIAVQTLASSLSLLRGNMFECHKQHLNVSCIQNPSLLHVANAFEFNVPFFCSATVS